MPAVCAGVVASFGNVQIPAGEKEAPGTRWHVAPAWQLLLWLESGSHVKEHKGRLRFSRIGNDCVGAWSQSVAMHCGVARILGGAVHGQTIVELLVHGSMIAGMLLSNLHSPEQYAHLLLLMGSITLHGQGFPCSG